MGEETVERTDKWTAEYTIGLHEGKDWLMIKQVMQGQTVRWMGRKMFI